MTTEITQAEQFRQYVNEQKKSLRSFKRQFANSALAWERAQSEKHLLNAFDWEETIDGGLTYIFTDGSELNC